MTTDFLKISALLTLGACVLAIAGCVDKSNPDTIDKRSVERWNYLIAHEAEKAYDYLTPGFRATQAREAYAKAMNSRPVQWKAAKFKSKKCESDRCQVVVDVTYEVRMPGNVTRPVEGTRSQNETWLLVDGAWYFLPN